MRPSFLEISLSAIEHNYKRLVEFVAPATIIPVLKANAYGHGLVEVAKTVHTCGAQCVGVALLEEALQLRENGFTGHILVFGGMPSAQADVFVSAGLDITVSSLTKLELVGAAAQRLGTTARVHLKIDTGFERIGVHHYSAGSLLEAATSTPSVEVVGIYSHLAKAEDDEKMSRLQLERFLECASYFEKRSLAVPMRHIANSAATIRLPESHLDAVRPGLLMYGLSPFENGENPLGLKPALSAKSTVVYFKVVKKGAGVSYGHTWTASEDTRVVTVPVGYADGWPRRLSNHGFVLIRGKRYPIVGRVCMDQFMVDIGKDGEAYNGDQVVLIGSQGHEEIRLEHVAEWADTIPHDIAVGLNARLPRRFA